jgi:tricorn protease
MKSVAVAVTLVMLALSGAALAQEQQAGPLLQQPTMSRTQIVFVYGAQLWSVSRDGGDATRLTSGAGIQTAPHFSPDGKWVAFSADYGGNLDVYVVAAAGGVPRRLTYHPAPDVVQGWTPDGKNILFESNRNAFARDADNLFTVPLAGGLPHQLPFPLADQGTISPDGTQLAYRPTQYPAGTWSHYRGGTESKIWIAKLADSSYREIPRGDWNDMRPMWLGSNIYFLSDQRGPFTLYAYDLGTRRISALIPNNGLPIMQASAGPDGIIYSQFGSIHIYDPATQREHEVPIHVAGDFAQVLPHFDNVADHIRDAAISPTGARALFEAHGEILTVPAEHGDIRNITQSPAVADRSPAWSPDGKSIAYFSDESGEYALHVSNQSGLGPVRKINLGDPPSFYYDPQWSPDSRKIAYTDKRLNLWYVNLDKGVPIRIDADLYDTPEPALDPTFSPDSQWIAYTKLLRNHMRAVFVYSLQTGNSAQITDGLSDAGSAVWDKGGKWLFFTASTDSGPTTGWLDMSSIDHTVMRNVYVVVLAKDLPSPFAPLSDEEGAATEPEAANDAAGAVRPPEHSTSNRRSAPSTATESSSPAPKVVIDLDGIDQRILAVPVPAADYNDLEPGAAGTLFLAAHQPSTNPPSDDGPPDPSAFDVTKFEMKDRKLTPVIAGIQGAQISFDGKKILYQQHGHWAIASTASAVKPGEGTLNMSGMKVYVDPRAEWRQMYHEVWRIERDFFYDSNLHGLDLRKAEAEYARYLPDLISREDENYLFNQMLSDLNVGHMFVAGGTFPTTPRVNVGLLGADYTIDHGRYRLATVYAGENWNPQLHAPLTQPGVNVTAGNYILAVDGQELRAPDNIYSHFLGKAGQQVVLRVGPNADGAGAREVTVVPVGNEFNLRHRSWIEHNMQVVNRLSDGKLAYVYLPNTGDGGYASFNRYYLAQVGKQGAVIDERFNSGGMVANYIIENLQRRPTSYWYTREGEVFASPLDAIFGPKVMIINQYAGSGGDWIAWAFKRTGLGPTVGERTWGGLVGIYGYPQLIDGGTVTAPRLAFFSPDGSWDVENHGVAPDVPILLDPQAWRDNHDTQLEKAVALAMQALQSTPASLPHVPAFPNYSQYAH